MPSASLATEYDDCMESPEALTILIAKIVGPVLLLRALSIVLDRKHFERMLDGLDGESSTVSFSMFPIALLMICLWLATVHRDTSSVAAWLIHIIIWGGILKASILILFPKLVVAKAQILGRSGFLVVVTFMTAVLGVYFSLFGYVTRG